MQVVGIDAQSTEAGKPGNFSGSVWNRTLALGLLTSRLHVAQVTFAPGGRTYWHTHPCGQILVAVTGMGRVQKDGEPPVALHPGDSVSIAPGERHWHGAAPDQVFIHIAMQEATSEGEQAIWLEPVSDDDYNKLPA